LLANMMRGNPASADVNRAENLAGFGMAQAGNLTQMGSQLQSYLQNGTLPPALQAQVNQKVAAEKAMIISNAAKNGQSTNPTQNTVLAQDLAAADRNGLIAAGDFEAKLAAMGQQMINAGLQATNLSESTYLALAKMDKTDQTNLINEISAFTAALGGGSKSITLKTA
jgi:hypothetical protein